MFSAIFVKDSDVAKLTFCAIDDPRTLNKTLYLRPPGNICSMNELVEMWEYKIDKKLKKIYISEEELLKDINGMYHCTCFICGIKHFDVANPMVFDFQIHHIQRIWT
jgi:NmrA-like family